MKKPEYMTYGEFAIISKIVETILANGHTISVYDGECFTVKKSSDMECILGAMATTGSDMFWVRDKANNFLGGITFLYGNASDGGEVVCDCTDNAYMCALCDLKPVYIVGEK